MQDLNSKNPILWLFASIINSIARVSTKMPPRLREISMNLSLLLLSFLGIVKYLNSHAKQLIFYTKNRAYIAGFILLLVLLVVSIDRSVEYKDLKLRKGFAVGWGICFGMMFIMSFYNPVTKGYFLWSIISLLFAFPFAMIWNERGEFEKICDMLSRNVLIAVAVFLLLNLLLGPFVVNTISWDYLGLVANPNNNGLICTAGYIAALYMLFQNKRLYGFHAVIIGFCIAISVASTCRTAQLTMAAASFVGAYFYLAINKTNGKQLHIKRIVASIIIIVLTAIAAKFILMKINVMDLNAYAFDNTEQITLDEQGAYAETGTGDLSSGRIGIWKAFIAHSTFWGNGNKTKGQQIEGVEASLYAHNNALEILYASGVIAFAGYLIWVASGLLFVFHCLRGKCGYHKTNVLVIMVFTGYFIQAMLEILIYPMTNIPTMMMYVCLMPIVLDIREEDTSFD